MNKAVFLDKDGVINENIYLVDGHIMSPATIGQIKIIPNVKEGIDKIKKMGFKVIVITNQPGVAMGYINEKSLVEMNEYLKDKLGIDEIYYCPHKESLSGLCKCRKPKIGLIERAKKDFNIDAENSYMVGDNLSDIKAGENAKVKKTFLIGSKKIDILNLINEQRICPNFIVPSLIEVAKKINEIESNI